MTEPAFESDEQGPGGRERPGPEGEAGVTAADVTDTTQRIGALIEGLELAMGGEWPSVGDLRRLPPEDFGKLARELSTVIDRLNTLRIELLGAGARSNARF